MEKKKPCVYTLILRTGHPTQQHPAIWHLRLALLHKQGEGNCTHEEK